MAWLTRASIFYIPECPMVTMNSNLTSYYFYTYFHNYSLKSIQIYWLSALGQLQIRWKSVLDEECGKVKDSSLGDVLTVMNSKTCSQNLVPKLLNTKMQLSFRFENVSSWLWGIETSVHDVVILLSLLPPPLILLACIMHVNSSYLQSFKLIN